MKDELPEGWVEVPLSSGVIVDIQTGFASGEHSRDAIGIAHIRPMNVSIQGNIVLDDIKYISKAQVDREERILRKGDVVFNNTNSPRACW